MRRSCEGFGLGPAAPGLTTDPERVAARQQVTELDAATFADSDVESLLAKLAEADLSAGKVQPRRGRRLGSGR